MVNWVVFFAVVAVAVVAGVAAYRSTSERRSDEAWAIELRVSAPTLTVLSHVAADGEVIEYPSSFAFPWWAVAETLAEIDLLCGVAV